MKRFFRKLTSLFLVSAIMFFLVVLFKRTEFIRVLFKSNSYTVLSLMKACDEVGYIWEWGTPVVDVKNPKVIILAIGYCKKPGTNISPQLGLPSYDEEPKQEPQKDSEGSLR